MVQITTIDGYIYVSPTVPAGMVGMRVLSTKHTVAVEHEITSIT